MLTGVCLLLWLLPVLAVASYFGTHRIWDGGYPLAEIRIRFEDKSGRPVQGVGVSITSSQHFERGYPVHEVTGTTSPVSTEYGVMILHQTNRGLQFGGTDWRLFWLIRMGYSGPRIECRFSHPGYADTVTSFRALLTENGRYARDLPQETITLDGQQSQMHVVHRTITMR